MKIDSFDRGAVYAILTRADLRLLADLCNDLPVTDLREYSLAHRETLGGLLETVEIAMDHLPPHTEQTAETEGQP